MLPGRGEQDVSSEAFPKNCLFLGSDRTLPSWTNRDERPSIPTIGLDEDTCMASAISSGFTRVRPSAAVHSELVSVRAYGNDILTDRLHGKADQLLR